MCDKTEHFTNSKYYMDYIQVGLNAIINLILYINIK